MQRIKSFDEFINNVTESKIESKKEIAGFKEAIEIVGLGTIKAKRGETRKDMASRKINRTSNYQS